MNGAGDDIFSSFLSALPASVSSTSSSISNTTTNAPTTVSKSEEESFFDQPAPSPQEKNKMSKDSILALYGTPSNQQSTMFAVPGIHMSITSNTLLYLKYFCTIFVSYFRRNVYSTV